jgi:hypothetical protein
VSLSAYRSGALFFEDFFHDLKYGLRLIDQLANHILHLFAGGPVGFESGFLGFGEELRVFERAGKSVAKKLDAIGGDAGAGGDERGPIRVASLLMIFRRLMNVKGKDLTPKISHLLPC